jgi:cytochrome c-type biogenesis protein CcmF
LAFFGHAVLLLVLVLLGYATVAGSYAAARGRRRLLSSAANAFVSAFACTALAAGTLVLAFVRNDFSLSYVANHSSRQLPLTYTLAALWSGQEGSLLLWLLVLTGVGAVALLLNRRLVIDVLPWTAPILAGIGAYFAFIPNAVASPFATQTAPPWGRSPGTRTARRACASR